MPDTLNQPLRASDRGRPGGRRRRVADDRADGSEESEDGVSTTAIDLFAGLGGWTLGATQAGVKVVWAGNHWPEAVKWHSANHSTTQHVCQDLQQADWSKVPAHELLLASPACQGHARARGVERPHHDACRSTAWAVVACAEFHRPHTLIVENVPEFLSWSLYQSWEDALYRLGYTLTTTIIDAADCGVPQNRLRAFVVGRLGRAVHLSRPTHSQCSAWNVVKFDRGNWSKIIKPGRAQRTIERIKTGRKAHGSEFVFSYYGATTGGRSLSRPLGTITTRDRWAVVSGDRMRMLTVPEARAAMGFPNDYQLPANSRLAMHLLGNAVCPPVAKEIVSQCVYN